MKRHLLSLKRILGEETNLKLEGVEVGVWRGETSAFLLKEFPLLFLHLVDPWKVWTEDERYFHDGEMGQLTEEEWWDIQQQARQNTFPYRNRREIHCFTSEKAAQFFNEKSLDFAFLDASHFYEDVIKDIEIWSPKIKADGLLLGHDYHTTGDKWGFGVKKAVDEKFGDRVFTSQGLVWGVRM